MSGDPNPSEIRKHPVTQLLSEAASGTLPTEAELDALKLSAEERRRVGDAAAVIVGTRAGGEHGEARRLARDRAESIIDELPAERQRPDYLREPEDEPTDPKGLAEQVSRSW